MHSSNQKKILNMIESKKDSLDEHIKWFMLKIYLGLDDVNINDFCFFTGSVWALCSYPKGENDIIKNRIQDYCNQFNFVKKSGMSCCRVKIDVDEKRLRIVHKINKYKKHKILFA